MTTSSTRNDATLVLHALDTGAGKLHRRILKFDLGTPWVIDVGAVGWYLADGGDLDWWLVRDTVVPLLLLGLAVLLLVLFRGRLGLGLRLLLNSLCLGRLAHNRSLLSHLALVAHHLWLLLLNGTSGVKSICRSLGWGMRVEAVLGRGTPPGSGRKAAWTALDATSEAWC